MERFIREVRDHEFPEAEVVYELLYLSQRSKEGGGQSEGSRVSLKAKEC